MRPLKFVRATATVMSQSSVALCSSVQKEIQNITQQTTLPVSDHKPLEVGLEAKVSTSIFVAENVFKKSYLLPSTTTPLRWIPDHRVKRSDLLHDSRDDVDADDELNSYVLEAKGLLPRRKKLCFDNLDGQRGGSKAASELCASDGEGENLKENSNERSNETSNSVENIKSGGIGELGMITFDPILSTEFLVNKDTVVKILLFDDYKLRDFQRVILTLTCGTNEIVLVEPSWILKHCLEKIKSCFGRKRIWTSAKKKKKTMGKTGPKVEVVDDDLYATPYSGDHVILRQKSSTDSQPDKTLCLSGATWVNILQLLPVIKSVLRMYENMLISKQPYVEYYTESTFSDNGFE